MVKMAINIDNDLLTEQSRELLSLLDDKNYKDSIKLINKEIRYLRNQIKRLDNTLDKLPEKNTLIEYTYDRQKRQRQQDLQLLGEIKETVKKARRDPSHVRLNSSILRFSAISLKNTARRAETKKYRTLKKVVEQKYISAVEIFYIRGFLEKSEYSDVDIDRLNFLLKKYIGNDFTNSLKSLLPSVNPDSMSNEVADRVHSLSYEFISKMKNNAPESEQEVREITEAMVYLEKMI